MTSSAPAVQDVTTEPAAGAVVRPACTSRLADCRCVSGHPAHHLHRCSIPGCAMTWNRRGEVIRLSTAPKLYVVVSSSP